MDDEALANLLSLLEGSAVPEDTARTALRQAGGSVELAICRIFAGRDAHLPSGVIDIDEESSPGRKKRRKAEKRAERTSKMESKVPKSPKSSTLHSSAAKKPSLEGMPSEETQAASESEAVPLRSQLQGRRLLFDTDTKELKMGNGWLHAPEDCWTSVDLDLGGLAWSKDVLLKDPPCLKLSSGEAKASKGSRGEMHCASEMGLRPQFAGKLQDSIKKLGGDVALKRDLLQPLFATMLSEVRYPPSSLSFSWRARSVDFNLLRRPAPADLMGPLPERPFKLLDNGSDAPADQPPHFQAYPLRPEQQRSLQWMLSRENLQDVDEGHLVEWRRFWTSWERSFIEGTEEDQLVPGALVQIHSDAQGPFFFQDHSVEAASLQSLHGEVLPIVAGPDHVHVKFGRSYSCVKCPKQELNFVDSGEIRPGTRVMLRPELKAPAFGWGGVTHSMVGIFLRHQDSTTVIIKWPTHPNWKGKRAEIRRVDAYNSNDKVPLVLDLRIRAAFPVRGGILADKIGYGKTATTIALIDHQLQQPLPEIPEADRGNFLPAKGTLIIVPSNLFEQWINEFSKFIWDGRPLRQQMKGGWSPINCPMKIFAMVNVSPLSRAKARDIANADVVICSYRLLYSPIYLNRRQELCGGSELSTLPDRVRALLHGKKMPSGRKDVKVHVTDWEELEFPVLEMFHWRRIVFDEFHELESFESTQQNSLQFLRSHFRWGLTGTPPVDNNAGPIFMSSLFRIDLPGYLRMTSSPGAIDLDSWEGDRLLTEASARFLDDYVRQNTAELPHIRLEERVVVVHHNAAERALYLGQAHEAPDVNSDQAFKSEESVSSLERLLKLCSHFQVGGSSEVGNASEECERICDQKERRLVRARNQLRRCARVMKILQQLLATKKKRRKIPWRAELEKMQAKLTEDGSAAKKLCEEVDAEEIAAEKESAEERLQQLDGHRPRCEELLRVLGPDIAKRGCLEDWVALTNSSFEAELLEKLLVSQSKEQAQNLWELHEASNSMDFFRRTVAALAMGKPEDRSCSVCMEDDLPLQKLAITPCAHAFCISCLRDIVAKFSKCSLCQRSLAKKDVRALVSELEGAQDKEPPQENTSGIRLDKYGTKLAVLVQKFNDLRRQDGEAKIILFVQFDDLKRKVCTALNEFGIPCATLQGSVGERAGIIRDWQNNPQSDTFVLLLSLAQSASGTNLTAASHVVFLHPMLAPAERAVGYEMQAIGRARRHGQRRDVVHVWRFMTADTLEQQITERHQGALWALEQERQAREQSPARLRP